MALALVSIALLLLPDNSFDQQQADRKHYCEMVELWNGNKHLPKEDRPGWPPYKGECHD